MPGIKIEDRNNIVSDLYHFSETLDNDPGGHKLKALAGAGVTLGAGLYAFKNRGLIPAQAKARGSLVQTLLSAAVPAAIYYAVQNRDRLGRAATGAAAGAIGTRSLYKMQKDVMTQPLTPAERAGSTMLVGAAIPAIYTMHQLQAARDAEKLQQLKTQEMDPISKAKEINRIRERKDMLTRYPMLGLVPGAGTLRSVYNSMHEPEPIVSAEDAQTYGLLPQQKQENAQQ